MIDQRARETGTTADAGPQVPGERGGTYCGQCGAQSLVENGYCVRCGHTLAATSEPGPHAQTAANAVPEGAPSEAATSRKACGCRAGMACAHDRLAGFGARALAFLIDAILVSVVAGLLRGSDSRGIASFADFVYFVAFWSTTGQTLGMRALRIALVRSDGQPLSWATGLLRYVGYVLSIIPLCLGLLWILWDPRKQGWHDKIAHTLVVCTH